MLDRARANTEVETPGTIGQQTVNLRRSARGRSEGEDLLIALPTALSSLEGTNLQGLKNSCLRQHWCLLLLGISRFQPWNSTSSVNPSSCTVATLSFIAPKRKRRLVLVTCKKRSKGFINGAGLDLYHVNNEKPNR